MASGTRHELMSPMPAIVVRATVPEDFDAIIDLVAGMFQDLGTMCSRDAWGDELQQALASRLGRDVAAFVAMDPSDCPIAVAVGVIDQRLPSPRRPRGQMGYVEWLATAEGSRRQGAARAATIALLQWFDEHEIDVVDVHSSLSAQPIYGSLGFDDPASRPMRKHKDISSSDQSSPTSDPQRARLRRGQDGHREGAWAAEEPSRPPLRET